MLAMQKFAMKVLGKKGRLNTDWTPIGEPDKNVVLGIFPLASASVPASRRYPVA